MIHQDPQLESIHNTGAITPEFAEILTPEAVNFVATLARAFTKRRETLLQRRVQRQAEIDAGKMPDFLPETEHVRNSEWAIKTCHRRNAHAIGGMAAQIPIKNDPEANEEALARVRADKKREVKDGHDGTWVAHPGLVPIAMEEFDAVMKCPNQIDRKREDVHVTAADLLKVPEGTITEAGLRNNISVSLQYLESWLRGSGCVPINNLMEDAATTEISRAQIWEWIHLTRGILDDGRKVTIALYHELAKDELEKIRSAVGEQQFARSRFPAAAEILDGIITDDQFVEFLTLPAYKYLT